MLQKIGKLWTGKRFLQVSTSALVVATATTGIVWALARKQVINSAATHHNKVYVAYAKAVERARTQPQTQTQTQTQSQTLAPSLAQTSPATTTSTPESPFAVALRDTRFEFPNFRLNVVIQNTEEGAKEKRAFDRMKNRPSDWMFVDESEGWARTFYVLPAKTLAAFEIATDVRDELAGWESTALLLGGYTFVVLFAFGWLFTRPGAAEAKAAEAVREKVAAISAATAEMSTVLGDLRADVELAAKRATGADPEIFRAIDDLSAQIRLLAVNGSIEAARSAETYRVFHVLMQEINQLATQSRELIKAAGAASGSESLNGLRTRIEALQAKLSGGAAAAAQPGSSSSSFAIRRVG